MFASYAEKYSLYPLFYKSEEIQKIKHLIDTIQLIQISCPLFYD